MPVQEDVREWVCELICDALRFAVQHEGGGDIALATGHETAEGSTAAIIEVLFGGLRKCLFERRRLAARPGALPPKYTYEHVYRILKVCPSFPHACYPL